MKFDVIVGNPPYQRETNEGTENGTKSVYGAAYSEFITLATALNSTYVSMIVPAKWYADKQTSLANLRHRLKDDGKLQYLVDYKNSLECFDTVRIVGGVCYFLYNKKYKGNCTITNVVKDKKHVAVRDIISDEYIIRDNIGVEILNKVREKTNNGDYMNNFVETSFFDIKDNNKGNDTRLSDTDYEILSSERNAMCIKYINENNIQKNISIAKNEYKLIAGKLLAGGGDHPVDKNGLMKILSGIYVANPNQVFVSTYLMIMHDTNETRIRNCEKYIKTKFVRFLLYLGIAGLNITAESFRYVPIQDFDNTLDDEVLYKMYELSDTEIEFIEGFIKEIL